MTINLQQGSKYEIILNKKMCESDGWHDLWQYDVMEIADWYSGTR